MEIDDCGIARILLFASRYGVDFLQWIIHWLISVFADNLAEQANDEGCAAVFPRYIISSAGLFPDW